MPDLDYSFSTGYTSQVDSAGLGSVAFVYLALYVYFAAALMAIAKKTGTKNGWFAWIPILNVFLMLKVAGKPYWWFILLLIPFVNIIIAIILWMKIAERVGKPSWWGILMLVPVVNLIVPGYLAWSKSSPPASPSTPSAPATPAM
ncbi:signal peptidase I [Candidatus Uhrbacteria bacterium]|nr:signal peptidase I [Candidatus Uhrbacteria bacterium]